MFNIIETFVSIDGEGPTSGELATFIRFSHCNLRCSWCDTAYSWDGTSNVKQMSVEEIYRYIKQTNVKNVTLTGGEPLIQPNIELLLDALLEDQELVVHIETNGSVDITALKEKYQNRSLHFILDYKCPASKMSSRMCHENLKAVDQNDVYKFVIAAPEDLHTALSIMKSYDLIDRCQVYFRPVTDNIEPKEIVEFMKEHCLNDARLQLQLHKYIWPREMRGV